MNIKILNSWLREYLKTKATPFQIAEKLSLTSFSVEKIEKYQQDFLYEMEITTNRPDLFSVLGIAREAAAVLPQFGIEAEFIPLKLNGLKDEGQEFPIIIKNDPKLVNRICTVLMEVNVGKSSEKIKERLETSGIRSLNNVIDITNYVMRVLGHPTHVFDFDRLNTKELTIKEATGGEKIVTLDGKTHVLNGGEIVATNYKGEIIDLLGIMGLENSVVTEETRRILYFIDNNEPYHIRNASMGLSIRTEAATLNEKGIDPVLSKDALLYGISLFEKYAGATKLSKTVDIFPNKPKQKTIEVSFEKINSIIGVEVDYKKSVEVLKNLGFEATLNKNSMKVVVPSFRLNDIGIEEDVIEEIARIYGYHNLPSLLPPTEESEVAHSFVDDFFWEEKTKQALKYWGFTETYTYSFVSEEMFEGPIENAVKLANPLTEEFTYMRNSLIPSLLKVALENKNEEEIKIFEIANVYIKKQSDLPNEILTLSGVLKKGDANFFEIKGILEQLFQNLGIKDVSFKKSGKAALGASVYIYKQYLGEIEVLDNNLLDFELNFEIILKYATLKKEFKPFAKYPPVVEDLSVTASPEITTESLINEIKRQSSLIVNVSLLDTFKDTRTFHIIYQDFEKNLSNQDASKIREKITSSLKEKFNAEIKS